jgi:predicted glycoside hydrolase/deacetylase ChbG (UPF0249 family)
VRRRLWNFPGQRRHPKLILRGRINATSIMVAAAHFNRDDANALDTVNSGEKRAALGLHVTLTTIQAVKCDFAPLREGRFLPLNNMLQAAAARADCKQNR